MNSLNINPPLYLFVALCIMALVHLFSPGARALAYPWNLLGIIPLFLGILINLRADRLFKENSISVKPRDETAELLTHGVFRFSRHPMYLGFVLILLGIAMLMTSMTPYIVVIFFALFMDRVFIRFEEDKLESTFGDTWREYKARVRRWL
ncbi:MAG: isoprenylcysteine carboxylmethyltransferase family protein [Deltaproteobacteria bacterium]|nr:isoprenylcysteine carboxylmethyltransferase family protein [Deltaproteobacteria bacterium]